MNKLIDLCRRTLFRVRDRGLTKPERDVLFEEYKQCLEAIKETNQVRRGNDKFFFGVHVALLTTYSSLVTSGLIKNPNGWTMLIALLGILMCFIWGSVTWWQVWRNRYEHYVARCIESQLPGRPLTAQDKLMNAEHPLMARHSAWLRYSLPWIFILPYLALPFLI